MPDAAAIQALTAYLDRLRLPAEWPEHSVTRAKELVEYMLREGFEFRRVDRDSPP